MKVKNKLLDTQVQEAHIATNDTIKEHDAQPKEKAEYTPCLDAKHMEVDDTLTTAQNYWVQICDLEDNIKSLVVQVDVGKRKKAELVEMIDTSILTFNVKMVSHRDLKWLGEDYTMALVDAFKEILKEERQAFGWVVDKEVHMAP